MGPALILVAGIVVLFLGGEVLVHHATRLANAYRVPKVVIGACILGFGTSLPELGVSLQAALNGSPDIALGNVVGSNIANVGLILGFGALLATLHVERRVIRADLPFGVLAALFLVLWVGPQGEVSRLAGIALLVAFVLYLWSSLRFAQANRVILGNETPPPPRPWRDGALIIVGLVGIAYGAELLVHGASDIARTLGVSERVITVSIVAPGTSLPELAATLSAVRKNETDLAVGNVAGSNLFNLLFVLGTTAVIQPVPVSPQYVARDFPIVAVFAVLAFPLLHRARRIGRAQGGVLLAGYLAYVAWTWLAP